MGIKNSIRVKKTYKMKFSPAVIVALASAQDEKKVPPRHPLQRLERLTEFSAEIMTNWFSFLPSQQKWIQKFKNNAERMVANDVDSTMKNISHMVDHPTTERDVMPNSTDTTVKIQVLASNKSPPDSESGPNDTFHNALVKETTTA